MQRKGAIMSWNRSDAEMAVALKRAELNNALGYKSKYDADRHNVCLALIRYRDNSTHVLAAYSNDSAIPQSIRLGLDLVPNLYNSITLAERFGCDGMAQFHTEPKLLNYLCATPRVRKSAFDGPLPFKDPFLNSIVKQQRAQATARANLLKHPEDMVSIALVTEIDCCQTCTKYTIDHFRARFRISPTLFELGKKVGTGLPTQYTAVKIDIR